MHSGAYDYNGELPEIQIMPPVTEQDGMMPHDAAQDGPMPHNADLDGTELHTTTIREAVKRFEAAGVPRAERTLVKWCSTDAAGLGRLDCQYDANDRKYYITEESIGRAIEEEKAKAQQRTHADTNGKSESSGGQGAEQKQSRNKELELRIRDLEFTNRGKDYVIERYETEREAMIGKLTKSSHRIGSLEAELRLLEAPKE